MGMPDDSDRLLAKPVIWEEVQSGRHEGVTALDLPTESHRYFVAILSSGWRVSLYSMSGRPATVPSELRRPDGWPTLVAAKRSCDRYALSLATAGELKDHAKAEADHE